MYSIVDELLLRHKLTSMTYFKYFNFIVLSVLCFVACKEREVDKVFKTPKQNISLPDTISDLNSQEESPFIRLHTLFDEIIDLAEKESYVYGKLDGNWKAYDLNGNRLDSLTAIQSKALKALNEYSVSLYGYGPIRLGMTVTEVEDVVGLSFIANESTSDCKMMFFDNGFPSIRLLFEIRGNQRQLERIYIMEPSIKTKSGIGLGSTETEILSAYGDKMKTQPHKYSAESVYYYYVPVDKKDKDYRLNFDFNKTEDRVKFYSVGRDPAIFYVEGCF